MGVAKGEIVKPLAMRGKVSFAMRGFAHFLLATLFLVCILSPRGSHEHMVLKLEKGATSDAA